MAQGDTITVRTNQDRNPTSGKISEDLEITVPSRVSVEVHGNNGDYDVSEVNGTVDLQADRSDVRLNKIGGNARVEMQRSDLVRAADLKGKLDLQGKGSDIELENIAGEVTINGSYSGNLEFKNLAKALHFESPNTDLRVAALPGQISMDLGELTGNNLVGPVHLVDQVEGREDRRLHATRWNWKPSAAISSCSPSTCRWPRSTRGRAAGRSAWCCRTKPRFSWWRTTDHGEAVNDFGAPIQKETDGHRHR